jgi:four helix bundle protein
VELCAVVFEITAKGPAFEDERFRNQIRDAAKSAPSLIAEGFARYTTREFVRYLRMARSELAEVQSNIEIGTQISYFSGDPLERARKLADRAMAKTTSLLKIQVRKLEQESQASPATARRSNRSRT